MLGHNNLALYYRTLFLLTRYEKFSVSDIENMIPFERDIFIEMINDAIQKQQDNT